MLQCTARGGRKNRQVGQNFSLITTPFMRTSLTRGGGYNSLPPTFVDSTANTHRKYYNNHWQLHHHQSLGPTVFRGKFCQIQLASSKNSAAYCGAELSKSDGSPRPYVCDKLQG